MTSYNALYTLDAELTSLHSAPPSPTTPALPIVHHDPPPFELRRAPAVSSEHHTAHVTQHSAPGIERFRDLSFEDPIIGTVASGAESPGGGEHSLVEEIRVMIKKADEEREETLRRFNETLSKALEDKDATLRHAQQEHEETMRRLIQGHEETIRSMTHEREETNRKMVSDIVSLVRKERES